MKLKVDLFMKRKPLSTAGVREETKNCNHLEILIDRGKKPGDLKALDDILFSEYLASQTGNKPFYE